MESSRIVNKMTNLEAKLHQNMIQSIRNLGIHKRIGIAFSGGVDSSLLAKICADLDYNVVLLTIGFEDSHDIEFSKKIADSLGYRHLTETISTNTFSEIATKVRQKINSDNLSWNENCIAFYYVSKLAKKHDIEKILTANGIDELFCGYNSYRLVISEGEDAVANLMNKKLDNEIKMMKAVNMISSEFSVEILQPFLADGFIEFAKGVPIDHKIKDANDLMRKHIIRKLALSIGVPKEAALKRKKALQYGSLIHKNLMKTRENWNKTF